MGKKVSERLDFNEESYSETEPELREIYPQHWRELALNKDEIALDPDYETYRKLDDAGRVVLVTGRDRLALAAYFIGFIGPEMHYRGCLTCFTDIFYVKPAYRKGWAGVHLFRKVEEVLRERGVKRWHVTSKLHKDSGALLRRLGFSEVEAHYSKVF